MSRRYYGPRQSFKYVSGPTNRQRRSYRARMSQMGAWRRARQRRTAHAKATRALTLIRKFKKEEERKILQAQQETMQIPIGGNWILEGFGPYCQVGNTRLTRIGNKITVESLAMRWQIKLTALEAIAGQVRLIIGIDRRPEGAVPATANIMALDNQINSLYSISEQYKGQFQILVDKMYNFDSAQGMKNGKFYMDKPIKVGYDDGNAGTVADLQRNNFFIMAMGDPATAAIDVDYSYKFKFTDA